MNDLARREALEVWLAAFRAALGIREDVAESQFEEVARSAELAFDRWWSRQSRRGLQGRQGRRKRT